MHTFNENIDKQELVTNYFAGQLSSSEEDMLLALLESDEEVQQLFKKFSLIRNAANKQEVDYKPAYNEFLASVSKPKTKTRVLRRFMSMAASIIIVFGLYVFFNNSAEVKNVMAVAVKTETLPDSSIVVLNSGAQLCYSNDFKDHRNVELKKGEAYFEVQSDKAHPFIVTTQNVQVKVLGTGFNVKIDSINNLTTITVLHGRVEVSSPLNNNNKHILVAHNSISFSNISTEFSQLSTANENELSWKTNKLIFKHCPLPEVVQILNNHFGSKIVLSNSNLSTCKLNASFNNPDLESIIKMMKIAFDLQIELVDDKQIINGPGC